MRKVLSIALLTLTTLSTSCFSLNEGETKIMYEKLYDRFLTEKVVTTYLDHTKYSYGFTNNSIQGHQNWFYGKLENGNFNELDFDESKMAFVGDDSFIQGSFIKGTNTVIRHQSNHEGKIIISGKFVSIKGLSELSIRVNNITIYEIKGVESNVMGIYVEKETYIKKGDYIDFIINGDVRWNPTIYYETKKETPLHYDSKVDTNYDSVGDVHPFYDEGKMKLYYLSTNGKFTADMAESDDMVIFKDTNTIMSSTNPPYSEGFATRVVKIDGKYYSFYGAYDRFEATKSSDGYIFENAVELNDELEVIYQAKIDENYVWARDPYAFYDDDINKWRIISLNYRESRVDGSLPNIDLALYTATSNGLERFDSKALPLIKFGKTNYEPEVPQMIKINNRWYLIASMSGRTNNHVGPLSYWIGDINTPIEKVKWNDKQEHILTGEDLCASQIVEVEGRYYLYGWIVKNFNGNYLGGTINIPQEIYVRSNGKLGVRLDPHLRQKINRGLVYSLNNGAKNIKGSYIKKDDGYHVDSLVDKRAELELSVDSLNRKLIELESKISNHALTGLYLKQGSDVIEVRYNNENQLITIGKKGVALNYSKLYVDEKLDTVDIKVIVENDILEVFINDTYALSTRVDVNLSSYKVGAYTNDSSTVFSKLNVYQLASKENFQDY